MFGTRTLGWYLTQRFLVAVGGAFLFCALLIYMIDLVELLRQSGKYGRSSVAALAYLALLRLPVYTEFLLAFAVLAGTIVALLLLNRRSELTVMRAGGMSAWQFLRPGMILAFALGVLAVTVYNPLAARARAEAERLYAETFGQNANLLDNGLGGAWLRQNGVDGQSVISAAGVANKGLNLTAVIVYVFSEEGSFRERIDARTAELKEGYWLIRDAWVVRPGQPPEKHGTYLLATYLTPDRAQDALGEENAVSFWELPGLIEVTEKANLSPVRLRIRYETLLARPFLCVAMVLLAATVSLRSFRSGHIQTMVVRGVMGGFGLLLLAEISRQIGVAGLAPSWVAVWPPILLAMFVSLTVLLHQEDG